MYIIKTQFRVFSVTNLYIEINKPNDGGWYKLKETIPEQHIYK